MSKPFTVLLHYTAPPVIGGVENVIGEHARLLQQYAYPVRIVAGRAGPEETDFETVVVPELDSQHHENVAVSAALDRGEVLPEFAAFSERIEAALTPILGDADTALIHNVMNFHFNLPLTAALYRMIDAGKVSQPVAWCHDVSRYVNPASGAEQRHGYPWDLLRTLNSNLTYVTVSHARQRTLAGILGIPPEQVRVIPNGVDPDSLLGLDPQVAELAADLELHQADLILLMPIRITRAKNIELGLRVTAALRKAGIRPRLIITGPPDPHSSDIQAYYAELLALRDELGIGDEATFLYEGTRGRPGPLLLTLPQVNQLYRLADVVFMPSHREGFGLPVLEGGLVGRLVVATPIPVLEEVGAENVLKVSAGDAPDKIAARLGEWSAADPVMRLRRRVRQEYTWDSLFARAIQPLLLDSSWE